MEMGTSWHMGPPGLQQSWAGNNDGVVGTMPGGLDSTWTQPTKMVRWVANDCLLPPLLFEAVAVAATTAARRRDMHHLQRQQLGEDERSGGGKGTINKRRGWQQWGGGGNNDDDAQQLYRYKKHIICLLNCNSRCAAEAAWQSIEYQPDIHGWVLVLKQSHQYCWYELKSRAQLDIVITDPNLK
jgi:hypothetical protein